MHSLRQIAALSILSIANSLALANEPVTIASGSPLAAIQQAIDEAHAEGGGVVLLESGEYTLDRALNLSDKKNVTLLGEDGAVFKAAAQQIATLAEDAPAGAKEVTLDKPLDIAGGVRFEIHSPGREVVAPNGKKFTTQYIMGQVERAEGPILHLSKPLKYAAPKGAKTIAVFNGIVVRGGAENVTIQNITVDMNRDAWPIVPKNHTYHCALIAQGPYSYEKGPSGPPVEGLRIVDCTIVNAHQRGIAFYSVVHSGVYDCHIENTGAEGIDFDHFAYHCEAVGNTLVDCHNIELNDASHCLVAHNRIIRPAVGVVVWQWCKLPGLNERNLILNNEITDSRGDGISLRSGADLNVVRGNTVRNSAHIGISIAGGCNIITGNRISGSKSEDLGIAGEGNVSLP